MGRFGHIGEKYYLYTDGFKNVTDLRYTRTDQGFGVGDRSWAVSGPKVVELGGFRLSDHGGHSTPRFQLRFSPGWSEKSAKKCQKVLKSAKKCQKVLKVLKSAKKS